MTHQQAHAKTLLADTLLSAIFDRMERDAMQQIIAAPLGDDEARRNLSGEVRAIQSVRRKLSHLAGGHVTLPVDPEA